MNISEQCKPPHVRRLRETNNAKRKQIMTTTNQKGSFAGKIAFVTGAGSGIGRATALAFARDGANVVVTDVSEQGNQETARLIEDRKSTRLNSSHSQISYAVFCLKKKKNQHQRGFERPPVVAGVQLVVDHVFPPLLRDVVVEDAHHGLLRLLCGLLQCLVVVVLEM